MKQSVQETLDIKLDIKKELCKICTHPNTCIVKENDFGMCSSGTFRGNSLILLIQEFKKRGAREIAQKYIDHCFGNKVDKFSMDIIDENQPNTSI